MRWEPPQSARQGFGGVGGQVEGAGASARLGVETRLPVGGVDLPRRPRAAGGHSGPRQAGR